MQKEVRWAGPLLSPCKDKDAIIDSCKHVVMLLCLLCSDQCAMITIVGCYQTIKIQEPVFPLFILLIWHWEKFSNKCPPGLRDLCHFLFSC